MKETEMIHLIREKNPRGMEELQRMYEPLIKYIIRPILTDPREREECLADVWMLIWDKIEQYDETKGKWTSWMTTLARNLAFNRYKREKLERTEGEVPENIISEKGIPEQNLIQKERVREFQKALDSLKYSEKQLFYRKYYYMQSTLQMAMELGLTERSVEGRLYRIKKRLQKKLGGEWYE